MRFFHSVAVLAALAAVRAQNVVIRAPPAQSTLSPGQEFVVDIDRGLALVFSQDVSVAIGLVNCEETLSGSCDDIDSTHRIGTVLFAGPYTPQPHVGEISQNFTVFVPEDFPTGDAALAVAHFFLLPTSDTSAVFEVRHEKIVIG
ncbi:hypothetical protein C8Q79DRAFT_1008096 [Trametes meyenii]|nr:hypothetical protein C8Q79DRAFT_1008096 [Trametes meyenii]